MNQDTIMQSLAERSSVPKVMPWLGAGLTGLVVLFLAFDGVTKVIRVAPAMEACQKMGIGPDLAVGIGLLLLACTTHIASTMGACKLKKSSTSLELRRVERLRSFDLLLL